MIEIYTDGSCCGNGKEDNCGGFGVVVLTQNSDRIAVSRIYSVKENSTTNNRMEMKAILKALELSQTDFKNEKVIIKSDSAYCVNMFNNWIHSWASNNWMRSGNKSIENLDLVKHFYKYAILEFPNFSVVKVSGHSGDIGNELADAAATLNIKKLTKILKENDIDYDLEGIFDF